MLLFRDFPRFARAFNFDVGMREVRRVLGMTPGADEGGRQLEGWKSFQIVVSHPIG